MKYRFEANDSFSKVKEVINNHINADNKKWEIDKGELISSLKGSTRKEYELSKHVYEYYKGFLERFPSVSFTDISWYLCQYTEILSDKGNERLFNTYANASAELKNAWSEGYISLNKVNILVKIQNSEEQMLVFKHYRGLSLDKLSIVVNEVIRRSFDSAAENIRENFPKLLKKRDLLNNLNMLNGPSLADPVDARFFNEKVFYEEDILLLERHVKSLSEKISFYKKVRNIDQDDKEEG